MCLANTLAAFERDGFGLARTVTSCAAAGHTVDAAQALFTRQAETCPAGGGAGAGGSEREANIARVKPLLMAGLDPNAPERGLANLKQVGHTGACLSTGWLAGWPACMPVAGPALHCSNGQQECANHCSGPWWRAGADFFRLPPPLWRLPLP